jgi:hypothetical protein
VLPAHHGSPHDPDANVEWVLTLYGAAMLAVQGLENAVPYLYLVANTTPHRRSKAAPKRQVRNAFERQWSAFQKGTARMKLNDAKLGIRPHIAADLYEDLDAFLVGPRAQLAHRFLIERIGHGEHDRQFLAGSALYLLKSTREETRLTKALHDRAEEILATWPKGERPPEEFRIWAEQLANLAMRKRMPDERPGPDAAG